MRVTTTSGETRTFVVGKSAGCAPCHLELESASSSGGDFADAQYAYLNILSQPRRNH